MQGTGAVCTATDPMHTPQSGMPGTLQASECPTANNSPTPAPHQPWACRNAALIRSAQLQGCLNKQRMRHAFPAPVYPNLSFQALDRWQPASPEKRHHQKDGERPGTCPCSLPMTFVTAASDDVGTLTDTNKREQWFIGHANRTNPVQRSPAKLWALLTVPTFQYTH